MADLASSRQETSSTRSPLASPRTRATEYAHPLWAFLIVFLAWQIGVVLFKVPIYLLPTPWQILKEIVASAPHLLNQSMVTVSEMLWGYFFSIILGTSLGLAVASWRVFERMIFPILVFFQLIPKIALAPLFIIWFGFGMLPKVLITFLLSFFPIMINCIVGFRSLDPEVVLLLRSMGARPVDSFLKIRLPSALPHIFAGLKISATGATVGAIVGEFVGSDKGLGYLLLVAQGDLNTPLLFAALAFLTAAGLILFYAVDFAERQAIPWHVSRRGEGAVEVSN